jgi:hypothetical protein
MASFCFNILYPDPFIVQRCSTGSRWNCPGGELYIFTGLIWLFLSSRYIWSWKLDTMCGNLQFEEIAISIMNRNKIYKKALDVLRSPPLFFSLHFQQQSVSISNIATMLRRNPVQLDCPPGDSRSKSSRSPEPSLAEQQNILFDFEHAVPKDGPPPGCDKGDSQSRRIHPGFPTDKTESSNSKAQPKDVLSRTSKATFDSAGAGSPIFRMSLPESDVGR